jgi:hypothetical protein
MTIVLMTTNRWKIVLVQPETGGGQSWATFVRNHAERMWACDFIQTHDLLFRQVSAGFTSTTTGRRDES